MTFPGHLSKHKVDPWEPQNLPVCLAYAHNKLLEGVCVCCVSRVCIWRPWLAIYIIKLSAMCITKGASDAYSEYHLVVILGFSFSKIIYYSVLFLLTSDNIKQNYNVLHNIICWQFCFSIVGCWHLIHSKIRISQELLLLFLLLHQRYLIHTRVSNCEYPQVSWCGWLHKVSYILIKMFQSLVVWFLSQELISLPIMGTITVPTTPPHPHPHPPPSPHPTHTPPWSPTPIPPSPHTPHPTPQTQTPNPNPKPQTPTH